MAERWKAATQAIDSAEVWLNMDQAINLERIGTGAMVRFVDRWSVTVLESVETLLTGAETGNLMLGADVLIISGAGVPVDYTDGDPAATGEGTAEKGSVYLDTTNGKAYVNGGTKAQPLWKLVTSA